MTSTPYDGKIGLWHHKGATIGEDSIAEVAATLKQFSHPQSAIWVKTSNDKHWQGHYDRQHGAVKEDVTIDGPADLERWVKVASREGIDVHAWSIPQGLAVTGEIDVIVQACNVPGLKSMILDVEVGDLYFRGGPVAAAEIAREVRNQSPRGFHIGLCLDARGFHPRDIHIDRWLPYVDSLHPMAYHHLFQRTVEDTVQGAFDALAQYGKPIIPALQSYNLDNPVDVYTGGDMSFRRFNAQGLSYYMFGRMGKPEFDQIKKLEVPVFDGGEQGFDFTNQIMIDAIVMAAEHLGQEGNTWLRSTGLEHLRQNPAATYAGPAVRDLPGLTNTDRRLVQDALDGTIDAVIVINDDDVPAPKPPPPDADEPRYTHQQMINAFAQASTRLGEKDEYWEYVKAAGLEFLAKERSAAYDSTPVQQLNGIPNRLKRLILLELREMTPIGKDRDLKMDWVSQISGEANLDSNDCGQTCVLMLGLFHDRPSFANETPNSMVRREFGLTTAFELRNLARQFGLALRTDTVAGTDMNFFREQIAAGRPVIALVDYKVLNANRNAKFNPNLVSANFLHWFVVKGFVGDTEFIIHDPYWRNEWRGGKGGASVPLSADLLRASLYQGAGPNVVY